MTGIEYPTITVGAHENLVVRHSLAAQVLMRRRGIDPAQIHILTLPFVVVDGKVTTERNLSAEANTLTVFSCMVAENFIDHSRPHQINLDNAPTADYWATQIEEFGVIEKVIGAALGKAAEDRRKKLAAVPPLAEQAS